MTMSKNETLSEGINKLSCNLKKSEEEIMDDIYYADLMNQFEDYGYNKWDYISDYDTKQGNIIIDHNEQNDCEKDNDDNHEIENKVNRRKGIYYHMIINEINKHGIFYLNEEFFDV
jgi:hypothetical protein